MPYSNKEFRHKPLPFPLAARSLPLRHDRGRNRRPLAVELLCDVDSKDDAGLPVVIAVPRSVKVAVTSLDQRRCQGLNTSGVTAPIVEETNANTVVIEPVGAILKIVPAPEEPPPIVIP